MRDTEVLRIFARALLVAAPDAGELRVLCVLESGREAALPRLRGPKRPRSVPRPAHPDPAAPDVTAQLRLAPDRLAGARVAEAGLAR